MSSYRLKDGMSHISLDDGKVNALGLAVLAELHSHLDRSLEDDAAALIVSGRPGVFCAGFDLGELRSDDSTRETLRCSLIDLELRMFEFQRPIIIACTGHALAAGAALLLSADRRIGIDGPFRLGFNEVTMGAAISAATVELARYRMSMPWFESLISGETFQPIAAQSAGLLDVVVESETRLAEESIAAAETLGRIAPEAFRTMRNTVRGATVNRIRQERARLGPARA
jgi:enoyl-CoA hydratase